MSRRVTTPQDISAVISLYNAKYRVSEIVRLTGVGQRTVYRLINDYVATNEQVLPVPKSRPGRPKLVSPRTQKVLKKQVNENPRLTARELKQRNPQSLSHVSVRTIQQVLHDLSFRSYRAHRKPPLTNHQKAKKYATWDGQGWGHVEDTSRQDREKKWIEGRSGEEVWVQRFREGGETKHVKVYVDTITFVYPNWPCSGLKYL